MPAWHNETVTKIGAAAVAVLLALGATGCGAPAPTTTPLTASEHSHDSETGEHITPLVGDGTRATEFGYTMEKVLLPRSAGVAGRVSFRIRFEDGHVVTDYIEEQTKLLHLYVVSKDLTVFRHLHPTLDKDGTWSARLTLPEPGSYRVIAEFVARADADSGDYAMIAGTAKVGGRAPSAVPDGQDEDEDGQGITVAFDRPLATGPDGEMVLVVRGPGGAPVELGSYLGAYAHVTGFRRATGAVAHLHPLDAPQPSADGTRLTFHTQFSEPGDYLFYVQVRVAGFLYTVPVPATVN